MFSEKALNLEEHELRELIRALPAAEKQYYHELELVSLKDPAHYLKLNWIFPLGLHHFYLQRWGRGTLNLGLTVLALILMTGANMFLYGAMLLIAVVLIELPQLLNARHLVHSRNNRIMEQCLKRTQRLTKRN
jgi:TM2 domain-containing membrane protein YozV